MEEEGRAAKSGAELAPPGSEVRPSILAAVRLLWSSGLTEAARKTINSQTLLPPSSSWNCPLGLLLENGSWVTCAVSFGAGCLSQGAEHCPESSG